MKIIECRSCKAPCFWAKTHKGKPGLWDKDPVPNGSHVIVEREDGLHAVGKDFTISEGPLYISHWATCPDAKEWKAKSEPQA